MRVAVFKKEKSIDLQFLRVDASGIYYGGEYFLGYVELPDYPADVKKGGVRIKTSSAEEQLAAVDNLLDELDRKNGDAPHRVVNRMDRIKVLCQFKNEKEPVTKPPLGVRPRFIVDEERFQELAEAIDRYKREGIDVPSEWLFEFAELGMAKEGSARFVRKEAIKAHINPNYAGGVNYITYELPICALDIKPPTYKIKE